MGHADVFCRTFNRRGAKFARTREIVVMYPTGATLAQLIELAREAGASLGGRGRHQGGIFEIQTDEGIWSTADGGKLDVKHGVFKTWEQLEAEELAERGN